MNTETIAEFTVVYLVGVVLALAVIALLNSKEDEEIMNEGLAVFSWFTLAFIILVIIAYFVTRPFNWLYEKMKAFFDEI